MRDFAGSLNEQVDILRRSPGWDAVGEHGEDWTLVDASWANVAPVRDSGGTRWRVTLRRCDVAVGDRLMRAVGRLTVREVVADPATPDRVTVVGEVEW